MTNVIAEVVGSCKQCKDGKKLENNRTPGLGSTSSQVNERIKRWSMDCVQMPPGHGGNKYLLTLLDMSTGWMEAFAMTNATSKHILQKLLEHILPRYGEGLVFCTDAGTEFTSALMSQTLKENGCHLYVGTPYWPNSTSVERAHRTLLSLIRIQLLDNNWPKEKWPMTIREALKTMRCAPNSGLNDSPFCRLFGKQPVLHAETLMKPLLPEDDPFSPYPNPIDQPTLPEPKIVSENDKEIIVKTDNQIRVLNKHPTASQYLIQHICSLHEEIPPQEIFQLAKDFQAARQHQKNASRYETKKVIYVPVVNEIVDHFRAIDPESKSSKKLAFFWDGPMAVTKINEGRKTVELQKIDPITMQKERKVKRVHCHYLRPSLIWTFAN